jgi:YggT family protein
MFVLRNLLLATVDLVDMALGLYTFLVIARALISWVSPDPYNPIVQFLVRATEPALRPIRRWLPHTGIDISPIILIFAIFFVQRAIVTSLRQIVAAL